jgi:hypothetical protein
MRQLPVRILRYLRKRFKTLVLAYSGGTDSTLLYLIAKEYAVPLDYCIFINTKLEYSGTLNYVARVSKILDMKLTVCKPELSAAELSKFIVEDFDRVNDRCASYDKDSYKCCYHAKETPMRRWLQGTGLDNETTCVLRGIRSVDSSRRMMSCLQLIESGQFYFYRYKHSDNAFCAHPIQLISNELKQTWLESTCNQYKIPLPEKSGCAICPIFFRYASPEERLSPRWKLAERFFSKRAKSVLDAYLYRNQMLAVQKSDAGE